jgi:hypothetical protein
MVSFVQPQTTVNISFSALPNVQKAISGLGDRGVSFKLGQCVTFPLPHFSQGGGIPNLLYPMPCTKYLKASASLAGCKREREKYGWRLGATFSSERSWPKAGAIKLSRQNTKAKEILWANCGEEISFV